MWRQIEGARSHLPIVGVTADATSETEARCLAAGMDLRLTKPINSGLLLSTIEKCCFGDAAEVELPGPVEDPLQIVVPLQGKRPTDGNEAIDPEHMDYLRSIGDDSFVASMIENVTRPCSAFQRMHSKVRPTISGRNSLLRSVRNWKKSPKPILRASGSTICNALRTNFNGRPMPCNLVNRYWRKKQPHSGPS